VNITKYVLTVDFAYKGDPTAIGRAALKSSATKTAAANAGMRVFQIPVQQYRMGELLLVLHLPAVE
jgi:hypothetical protein